MNEWKWDWSFIKDWSFLSQVCRKKSLKEDTLHQFSSLSDSPPTPLLLSRAKWPIFTSPCGISGFSLSPPCFLPSSYRYSWTVQLLKRLSRCLSNCLSQMWSEIFVFIFKVVEPWHLFFPLTPFTSRFETWFPLYCMLDILDNVEILGKKHWRHFLFFLLFVCL